MEHAAKVEAESLFEAAARGLYRLKSSFWTEEEVFDRMFVTVEVFLTRTSVERLTLLHYSATALAEKRALPL